MFIKLLIISFVIIGFAVIGLAFNIIFRKDGKFPETGIGHNPEMRKRGIACAKTEEIRQFNINKKILATKEGGKLPPAEWSGCAGCNCGN